MGRSNQVNRRMEEVPRQRTHLCEKISVYGRKKSLWESRLECRKAPGSTETRASMPRAPSFSQESEEWQGRY